MPQPPVLQRLRVSQPPHTTGIGTWRCVFLILMSGKDIFLLPQRFDDAKRKGKCENKLMFSKRFHYEITVTKYILQ